MQDHTNKLTCNRILMHKCQLHENPSYHTSTGFWIFYYGCTGATNRSQSPGESVWDHPCDEHYRKVYEKYKAQAAPGAAPGAVLAGRGARHSAAAISARQRRKPTKRQEMMTKRIWASPITYILELL